MSRQTIRYAAAGLATAMALIYFLIGLGVVQIAAEEPSGSDLFGFGVGAGVRALR